MMSNEPLLNLEQALNELRDRKIESLSKTLQIFLNHVEKLGFSFSDLIESAALLAHEQGNAQACKYLENAANTLTVRLIASQGDDDV